MRTATSKEREAQPSEQPCTCLDLSDGPGGPGGPGCSGAFRSNLNFSPEDSIRSHTKTNALQAIFRLGGDSTSSSAEQICEQDGDAPGTSREWFVDAASEFLATALLMFVGCSGAFIEMTKPSANVYGSAAFGVGVFMCTTLFGNVSGAHMNPLVTLVNWAFTGLRWRRVLVYIASQMLGALVGQGVLYLVVPQDVQTAVGELTTPKYSACCTRPLDSMSSLSAVLAEFVVTSVLLGAVAASIDHPPPAPGLHFGVLVFGICATEAMYTGSSMNPARSIASAVWTGVWDRFWVYVVGHVFALAFVVATVAFFRKKKQC